MLAAALALIYLARGDRSKVAVSTAQQSAKNFDAQYEVIPGVASMHDCYQGIFCTGETGSGKSSGPMRACIINVLRHPSRPGALVMAAKEGTWEDWVEFGRASGRPEDLVRFAPGLETCDLLAMAFSHKHSSVRDAVALLDHLLEVDKRESKSGGGDNAFWFSYAGRINKCALSLLYYATGTASIGDVYRLIQEAPSTPKAALDLVALSKREDVDDETIRRTSLIAFCMRAAARRKVVSADYNLALNFFTDEYPRTGEKQRAAGTSIVINLLDNFLSEEAARTFSSGESSCPPSRILDRGAIVVLDMPLLTWGATGRFAQICMKVLLQKHALMRSASDSPRPCLLAQDEFQSWALPSHDSYVQSVSRESRLISLAATQNIALLRSCVGGDSARDEVAALISNHSVKLFASNSDIETNAYASALCGQDWIDVVGGSIPGRRQEYNPLDDWTGRPCEVGPTLSFHPQKQPNVEPSIFNRLLRGGQGWVECIAFQNGKTYPDTGGPWTRVYFDQNFGKGGV
jgi:hypothetical protein